MLTPSGSTASLPVSDPTLPSIGPIGHAAGPADVVLRLDDGPDVAVSDLNGCQPCTAGHVEKARHLGWADEAILEAVQCAATMAAGAKFLSAAR